MDQIKYDIYLSGAMHGRLGRDVLKEREIAKSWCKWYGLTYYDPAEDEVIDPEKVIDSNPNLKTMTWYVEKDETYVDQSRFLLVLTGDISSSGALWEMGQMHYKNHRPIFVISPKMYHGQLANFTTIKATKIFKTTDMAVKYIFELLRGPKCLLQPKKIEI